jgi:hypothetical protein
MTCPNASTTITIPLTGSALLVKYDQNCNVLNGANFKVYNGTSISFPQVTSISAPAVAGGAGGLNFSANGAPPGTTGTFTCEYVPNGLTDTVTYIVGAPVTAISSGTSTP